MVLLFVSSAALAGDFDWLKDLNVKAEVDPSGFRARVCSMYDFSFQHSIPVNATK